MSRAQSLDFAQLGRVGLGRVLFAGLGMVAVLVSLIFWSFAQWNALHRTEQLAAQKTGDALAGLENQLLRCLLPAVETLVQFQPGVETPAPSPLPFHWFQRMPALVALYQAGESAIDWTICRDEAVFHMFHASQTAPPWTHADLHGAPKDATDFNPASWEHVRILEPQGEAWHKGALELLKSGAVDTLWCGVSPRDPSLLQLARAVQTPGGPLVRMAEVLLPMPDAAADSPERPMVMLFTDSLEPLGQRSSDLTPESAATAENFKAALLQWQPLESPPSALFLSDEWHKWWYAFRQCKIGNGVVLWVGARAEHVLISRPLEGLAVYGLAVGLLFAAWAAAALNRHVARPLAALSARMRTLESMEADDAEWPESRITEIDLLVQSCKGLTRQMERRTRALSGVQTLEATALPAGTMDSLAQQFMQRVSEERESVQESAAPEHSPEMEGPQSPILTGEFSDPPRAFVQAMQSTRRQLSSTELKLAALYKDFEALTERARSHEQRLFAQRKALGMLARASAANGPESGESLEHLLELAVRALNVHACGLWLASPGAESLSCVTRYDRVTQAAHSGGVLARSENPVFFIAAESQDVIRVRDVKADPRSPRLPMPEADSAPRALLIAPVLANGKLLAALCCEHLGGVRTWTVDEENFALALAQFALQRIEREKAADCDAASGNMRPGGRPGLSSLDMHEEAPMYRWVLDSAASIVWSVNAAGTITYANLAAEEAYGCDAMDMIGRPLSDFVLESALSIDAQALRRVLSGEEVHYYETEHRSPAGKTLPLRVTLTLLQDETGAEIGAVGVAELAGETRRKERALRESLAQYRELVDSAPQIIWSVDAIGCITSINPASQKIYGYSPRELIGQPLTVLAWEGHGPRDLERLYRLLAGTPCTGYHTCHRTKDGRRIEMLVAGEARRDERGRVNGALGMALIFEPESGGIVSQLENHASGDHVPGQ